MTVRDYAAYTEKFTALQKRGIQVGDELTTYEDEGPANIWLCQYQNKKHLIATISCVVDVVRGPRIILVSKKNYRGPGMKLYLNDQSATNIRKIKVTSLGPRSGRCDVIEKDK